jgi:protein SCO1
MRSVFVLFVLFVVCPVLTGGCSGRGSGTRQFTLQGQVTAIAPDRAEATIKHEEIKGFMPAMTMPYRVSDPKLLAGIVPGDLVTATLVVVPNDAYLSAVKKVGNAPLEKPAADATASPSASSGFELLKPGERVPDTPFVDQNGRKLKFVDAFKGHTVVVTFMYTRCPLPNFCPLMDRNFARIQEQLKSKPELAKKVHLVTISFDPATDTPPVLKQHAQTLHADPKMWTFLTGTRDDITQFGAPLGLSVMYEDDKSVTHNLRTAIIDPEGRLVKVYNGNDWTPDQIIAAVGN